MRQLLKSRLVVITGCSSGFGHSLVKEFLNHGWTVVATMRNLESRKNLFAEQLLSYKDKLFLFELDVNDSSQRQQLVKYLKQNFNGTLNCLINNAGQGFFGASTDFTEEQIRSQMEVNFFSAAFLTQDLIPALIENQGRIINVSSLLGFTGMPFSSVYAASKFALEGFTEGLYFDLQSKKVQVGLVEPGAFRTNFLQNTVWTSSPEKKSLFAKEAATFSKLMQHLGTRPNYAKPETVAERIVELAEMAKMPLRTQIGMGSRFVFLAKRFLPQNLFYFVQSKAMNRMMQKAEKSS